MRTWSCFGSAEEGGFALYLQASSKHELGNTALWVAGPCGLNRVFSWLSKWQGAVDPVPWKTAFTPPLKTSPSWWAGPTAMGPSAASSPTSSTSSLRGPMAIWLPCGAVVPAMPTTGLWLPHAELDPRNASVSRTAAASTRTAPACWGCPRRCRPVP